MTAADVSVRPVAGRREMRAFVRLPWRIYAGDPLWVPPLLMDMKAVTDRTKHPFHRHADVEYFVAWRQGKPVGRIAAIVNHAHNEFHGDRVGFFGLFEAVDDVAVAGALLETAEAWLLERGMDAARGPVSLSTNEEVSVGLLIDGFDAPPVVMTAYNPPYYAPLIEAAGYAKEKDLLAYDLDGTQGPPERLVEGVERLRKRAGVTIRTLDPKRFDRDVERIEQVYNSAWERNWGFVPMTSAEFAHLARELKPVVDPDLCLLAEKDDEPVGFALALPDFNQALKRIDGRLFPTGIFKLLWYRRKIDRLRVITLGLRPGYRRAGLDAAFYLHYFRLVQERGLRGGEASWILEDNWEMRRGLERMGGEEYRRFRIYEKPLARKLPR